MDIGKAFTVKRAIATGAGAVLLALLASSMMPDPVEVDATEASRGPLASTVDAEGVTRLRDAYTVTAPVTGRLERITLKPGDIVTAGDVIARITPLPLDAQAEAHAQARVAAAAAMLQEAETRLAQARESLQQAERNAARMRAVAEAGALAAERVEQAELQLALARQETEAGTSRARAARAELAAARSTLLSLASNGRSGTAVRAPASGRVMQLHDPSERVVAAGTPLLQVGDAAAMEVAIDVLSTEAVRIPAGAAVRLVEWGGPDTVEARVRLVEPSASTRISALGVEEQRVLVIADLLNPPAALGSGYQVQARIVTWEAPDVVRVPNSALFRRGDDWHAFVVDDGRAVLRAVIPGQRGQHATEIRDGLAPGELVIVFPSDLVSDGSRVRVLKR
jgi:HlyD family secretion protein